MSVRVGKVWMRIRPRGRSTRCASRRDAASSSAAKCSTTSSMVTRSALSSGSGMARASAAMTSPRSVGISWTASVFLARATAASEYSIPTARIAPASTAATNARRDRFRCRRQPRLAGSAPRAARRCTRRPWMHRPTCAIPRSRRTHGGSSPSRTRPRRRLEVRVLCPGAPRREPLVAFTNPPMPPAARAHTDPSSRLSPLGHGR